MATFTWLPDYGATAERRPRFKIAQYGDGYEQRIGDGINTIAEVWQLTFSNREATEAGAIDTFLRARAGVENFDWTPPGGTAGKYVCRDWQRTFVAGNIQSIAATFQQVFEA